MRTSETPLSDLIADHHTRQTRRSYKWFLEEFRRSMLGVVGGGIPEGTMGETDG